MRSSFILILAALVFFGCDTSNNVEPVYKKFFIRYYGSEGEQSGVDFVVNDDGSLVLLGNSILPSGNKNAFVIKTNGEGNVLWETNIGQIDEQATDIELIKSGPNGGSYVVAVNKGPENASRIKLYIINQSGEFVNPGTEIPLHKSGTYQNVKSITSLSDGGFVITGSADGALIKESSPEIPPTSDTQDILAFLLDVNLAIVDTVVNKGGETNGTGIRIFESTAATSQYVYFGSTNRPYNSTSTKLKYAYDQIAYGIPIGKVIGSDSEDYEMSSTVETPDAPGGGFLMAGTAKGADQMGQVFLVKVNATLDIKTFEQKLPINLDMEGVTATPATDGYYVLANEFVTTEHRDIMLVTTSLDGVILSQRSFGTSEGDDYGAAVRQLTDGRVAIVGTMELQTRKKLALIVLTQAGDF